MISPHASTSQRAEISLEMHFIASLELACRDHATGAIWEEPTSWDCAVLPGLAYKPDLMWAFDGKGNRLSIAGTNKVNLGLIHQVIICEVLEVGIKQHSAARDVEDSVREQEIRKVLEPIPVTFVYVTVAAYNHSAAHEDDKFFAKGCASDPNDINKFEYNVVTERKTAWQQRIQSVLKALDLAKDEKTNSTIWIGH